MVHSDINKLEEFLSNTLGFDEVRVHYDEDHNQKTLYDKITSDLDNLIKNVPFIGDNNQHNVIFIAYFGHGGKYL
jgi:Mn-dependent DtxR family transcriptional regulator